MNRGGMVVTPTKLWLVIYITLVHDLHNSGLRSTPASNNSSQPASRTTNPKRQSSNKPHHLSPLLGLSDESRRQSLITTQRYVDHWTSSDSKLEGFDKGASR
eukprot:5008633-Amphidinium_carterae.1